ncbi:hypothetical protein [Erythrobacter sp. JK5]|uniref:hypothetical protein n=1 Tax=Erythrobacter sp. JK5 TaxID=2829500 RepID=UPI001BA4701A|nr:hypothetical protein [Erythrobacter sp. JK5]QUL38697.1 hypothetical protein KDC96_04735 [Erythrobacter sp. JK5]
MTEGALISIVAMIGWLILVGSALSSYKLGWSKIARLALTWGAIFGGFFLLAYLFGAKLPN